MTNQIKSGPIKAIDSQSKTIEIDLEKNGFSIEWEVALAFTKKVYKELDMPRINPNNKEALDFIIQLIDRHPRVSRDQPIEVNPLSS